MELGAKLAGPGTEWNFEECQPLYKVHQYNNQWITDLFDRYAPIDVGIQEIKGSRCVGYRVIPDSPETLWFDLNHDGLVRKVEVSANVHADDWECTEFQQTNTGRWFPKRGTYRFANESEYQFEVVAVTMNEPFPASEFEPPPIDEQTIVVDRTGGLLGIQKKKKNTDSSTLTSNGTPPAVPKSPLIAVPSSKTWIWVLAVFLSVLCLIVGWRSRQQS